MRSARKSRWVRPTPAVERAGKYFRGGPEEFPMTLSVSVSDNPHVVVSTADPGRPPAGARQPGRSCRIMIRSAVLTLASLVLLAPAGLAQPASSFFAQSSHDFGSVPRGPILTHYYHFTNT